MGCEVLSLGELLVEVMRKEVEQPLDKPADFVGPFPSGAPAIFIDALAKLGAKCGFIGCVGDDDFGKCITERLEADGVDSTYITKPKGYTTGVAFVAYFKDGSRKFIFHLRHAAAGQLNPDHIQEDYVSSAKFLHIMGSALSINDDCSSACYKAAELVKNGGGKISLDPNLRPELLGVDKIREICQPILELCDLVLPSGEEAQMLMGVESGEEACRRLIGRGIPIVALKEGERGSTIFTSSETFTVPSYKVNPIDPTGAGDCYDAGFVYGMLQGWNLKRTAAFANAMGALATTRKGPMEGTFSLDEVMALM